MNQAAIEQALTTGWLGRPVHYFSEIGSTNDYLRVLADEGAPAGSLAIAELQTAGKGRLGRRWTTPPNTALLMSLLFRPNWPVERASWLTMLIGLAAVDGIAAVTGLRCGLKWPNDVVVADENGLRKIGGILLEASFEGELVSQAIIGMGLNVNLTREQLPTGKTLPSSLLIETGAPVERTVLLNGILSSLERRYAEADAGRSPHEAWAGVLVTLNRPVTVTGIGHSSDVIQGTATGVDAWGRLIVEDETGQTHQFAAGDVTLRSSE